MYLEVTTALHYNNRDSVIHAHPLYALFHQSKCIKTSSSLYISTTATYISLRMGVERIFSRGGQKRWNLFFTPQNWKKQFFLL